VFAYVGFFQNLKEPKVICPISRSHTLSLSRARTHEHTRTDKHTHTHNHTQSHTQTHTHTHAHTHTNYRSICQSHTHAISHFHTHKYALTRTRWSPGQRARLTVSRRCGQPPPIPETLQGYLAHKKQLPPWDPTIALCLGPCGGSGGWAAS